MARMVKGKGLDAVVADSLSRAVSSFPSLSHTDLGLALGHFAVTRQSAHGYAIHDQYDFDPQGPKDTLLWLSIGGPMTIEGGARNYAVSSRGKL